MSSDMFEEEERTVFVRNLDENVTKEILEELFIQMGTVLNVSIKESKAPTPNSTNKNRFAFVEFQDPESVLFAVEMLDDIELFGRNIVVAPRDRTRQAAQHRKLRDQFMMTRVRYNPNQAMPPPSPRNADGSALAALILRQAATNFAVPPPPVPPQTTQMIAEALKKGFPPPPPPKPPIGAVDEQLRTHMSMAAAQLAAERGTRRHSNGPSSSSITRGQTSWRGGQPSRGRSSGDFQPGRGRSSGDFQPGRGRSSGDFQSNRGRSSGDFRRGGADGNRNSGGPVDSERFVPRGAGGKPPSHHRSADNLNANPSLNRSYRFFR